MYKITVHRLCVWLCDDCYVQICYFNQCLLFTFWTLKKIIFQKCIFPYSFVGFIATYRAQYPFCLSHYILAFHLLFLALPILHPYLRSSCAFFCIFGYCRSTITLSIIRYFFFLHKIFHSYM